MTLTDYNKIREELNNSPNNIKVLPEDLKTKAENPDDLDGEIQDVEFEEDQGWYEITMEDGRYYRVCAVCGHTQEMNLQAMKETVPELVKDTKELYKNEEFLDENGEFVGTQEELEDRVEGDLCRWDNNRCETRHPPYEPGYLQEA